MGYRLQISKIKHAACGGKLYGYTSTNKLKSYKWLKEKGFIDDDYENFTFAECDGNPQIVMRNEDFKKFIKLYNEDCNNYKGEYIVHEKDWIINDPNIKELINDEEKILLEWY